MQADVYQTKNPKQFLIVPTGGDINKIVPEAILKKLGKIRGTRIIDMSTKSMMGADPAAIEADLDKQGYSIRLSHLEVTFKEYVAKKLRGS